MKSHLRDLILLGARLAVAAIFIPHGYAKVFGAGGVAAFAGDLPSYGVPAFLGYAAAYSELLGALLLAVGFLVRLDALLLACTMFVATFVVNLPDALHGDGTGLARYGEAMKSLELPLSLLAANSLLMIDGGGRWAADALLGTDRRAAAALARLARPGARQLAAAAAAEK
jgi:putative oxidoreductase